MWGSVAGIRTKYPRRLFARMRPDRRGEQDMVLFPRTSCDAETAGAAARLARKFDAGGFFLGVSPPDPRCSRFALGTTPPPALPGRPPDDKTLFSWLK
jgi:hypothetical protein